VSYRPSVKPDKKFIIAWNSYKLRCESVRLVNNILDNISYSGEDNHYYLENKNKKIPILNG